MSTAIEVEDLSKTFSVPDRQNETLKERLAAGHVMPRASRMSALDGISFEIGAGEFFGVTGRNGSGKSSLLKVMAGIYQADAGIVRAHGKIAPIIELGVGFHPELTATENILLNGVMMGLTESQARGRLVRIIEFAGLEEFMTLKLKNYSSGMRVRLAFSIMVHVEADVMLIDEVLAVGDGAFKAQSEAALRELNAAGRTIVLVTHSMPTIKNLCDRALLLDGGNLEVIGDPGRIGERYEELAAERQSLERVHVRGPEDEPANGARRGGAARKGEADTSGTPAIPGPSAFGGGWRRFAGLLWLTSRTEFKLRYHGSILGYSWSLLNPLLLFGVIYLFFSQVIRFGGEVENYAGFLLFNIMLFRFFTEATNGAVASIVNRERMVRTTDFPRLVIPLSSVFTSGFNLLFSLPVGLLYLVIAGAEPTWTWLLLPVLVGLLLTFTIGVSLLLSTLYVTIRDLSQIWAVIVQALFYATPVIYPISLVPESWRELVYANPLAPIFTQVRHWIVDPGAPSAIDAVGGPASLIAPTAIFVGVCAAGLWLFVRRAPRVAELL